MVVLTINLCWFLPPLLLRLSPLGEGGAPPASLTSFSPVHLSRSPGTCKSLSTPWQRQETPGPGRGVCFLSAGPCGCGLFPPRSGGSAGPAHVCPSQSHGVSRPSGGHCQVPSPSGTPCRGAGGRRGALCCPGKLQRSSAVSQRWRLSWRGLLAAASQGHVVPGHPGVLAPHGCPFGTWCGCSGVRAAPPAPGPARLCSPLFLGPVPPDQELPLCWSRPHLAELPLSPAQTRSQAGEQHSPVFLGKVGHGACFHRCVSNDRFLSVASVLQPFAASARALSCLPAAPAPSQRGPGWILDTVVVKSI